MDGLALKRKSVQIGYSALLVNAEMLLVGAEPWRTTVTWSEASAWSELTIVDMFTFLHRASGRGEECTFIYLFILRGQPVIVKMKEWEGH